MMKFKEELTDMNVTIKTEDIQIDSILPDKGAKSRMDSQAASAKPNIVIKQEIFEDGYISSDSGNQPEKKSTARRNRSVFECNICAGSPNFFNKASLGQHLDETHSSEEVPSCKECSFEAKDVHEFNKHLMRHDAAKRQFQCSICLLRFSISASRLRHEHSTHGVENAWSRKYLQPATWHPPYCNVCKTAFERSSEIVDHVMQAHPDRAHEIYPCPGCKEVYFNPRSLAAHKNVHTDRFTCDLCSKRYPSRIRLAWHKLRAHRVNIGGFDFVNCPLCGKEYNRGRELKNHLKSHEKSPKYHKAVSHPRVKFDVAHASSYLNPQPHVLDTNVFSACVVKMEVDDDSFSASPGNEIPEQEFPKAALKKRRALPTLKTCPKCGNQIIPSSMSKHQLICVGTESPSVLGNQHEIKISEQNHEVRTAKVPCDRCGGLFSPRYLFVHKRSKLCKGKP